eukprot:scaffold446005_cov31-Prasinocladus_malaysianus.AAC.1
MDWLCSAIYLDRHAGAVEALREERALAKKAVEGRGKLQLRIEHTQSLSDSFSDAMSPCFTTNRNISSKSEQNNQTSCGFITAKTIAMRAWLSKPSELNQTMPSVSPHIARHHRQTG